MPQCQFLFSAIFVFQKSYIGNILGIGRNESQSSYLPDTKMESKGEMEGARGQPHHRLARATLAAPQGGVDPWSTP
jgi:hypothetical protein